MAQTQVVYNNVSQGAHLPPGELFAGIKFWVALRVPTRTTFLNQIRANGGQIVVLEQVADITIADHLRKDAPPGSCSYTWIEASIRDGELANMEEHRVGPSVATARPVGSGRPARTGGRNPYSHADDLFLYDWVEKCKREGKKEANYWKGNDLYKQLEAVNNRHPWQSWRDRYIKYVSLKTPIERQNGEAPDPTPIPPSTQIPTTAEILRLDGANDVPSTAPPAVRGAQQQPAQEQSQALENPNRESEKNQEGNRSIGSPNVAANSDPRLSSLPVGDGASGAERATGTPQLSPDVEQTPDRFADKTASSSTPKSNRKRPSTPLQGQRSTPLRQSSHAKSHLGINAMFDSSDVDEFDFTTFTEEEKQYLLSEANDIQEIPVGIYDGTWDELAKHKPAHSAKEWRDYYEIIILPLHRAKHQQQEELADDTQTLRRSVAATPAAVRPLEIPNSIISPPTKRKRDMSEDITSDRVTYSPEPSKKHKVEQEQVSTKDDLRTALYQDVSSQTKTSRRVQILNPTNEAITIESDNDNDEESNASDKSVENGQDEQEVEIYECDVIEENDQENLGTRPPAAINNHRNTEQSLRAFSEEPTDFVLQANDSESSSDEEESSQNGSDSSSEASEKEYLDALQNPVELDEEEDEEDLHDELMMESGENEIVSSYPRLDTLSNSADPNGSVVVLEHETAEDHFASHDRSFQDGRVVDGSDPIELDLTVAFPLGLEDEEPEFKFNDLRNEQLDTQAFLRSDTPVPDLGIPIPPDEEDFVRQVGNSNNEPLNTQAFLRSDTPVLEFGMPVPTDNDDGMPGPSQTRSNHDVDFDSQGFLHSESQRPESITPDAENEDDASEEDSQVDIRAFTQEIRSSPPPIPDTGENSRITESEPTNLCTEDDLDDFISYHVDRGCKVDDIMYALDRTTMHATLAEKVLEALRIGAYLPKYPGIWTEEDDEILKESTAEGLEGLRRYHGEAAVRARQGSDVWNL